MARPLAIGNISKLNTVVLSIPLVQVCHAGIVRLVVPVVVVTTAICSSVDWLVGTVQNSLVGVPLNVGMYSPGTNVW
jgi:hypothetical protein